MDIVQNLKEIAQKRGLTLTEIERMCGFPKSSIRKWSENIPTIKKVLVVCEKLNISLDYLVLGKPGCSLSEDELSLLSDYNSVDDISKIIIRERAAALAEQADRHKNATITPLKHTDNTVLMPENDVKEYIYLDYPEEAVSAGTGEYLTSGYSVKLEVPSTDLTRRADYALRVSGDSMEPDYLNGDIVLVVADEQLRIGDVGIFILNGEGYIKEYGGDRLISYNDKYRDIVFKDDDECRSCGKVIGKLEDKNDAE